MLRLLAVADDEVFRFGVLQGFESRLLAWFVTLPNATRQDFQILT